MVGYQLDDDYRIFTNGKWLEITVGVCTRARFALPEGPWTTWRFFVYRQKNRIPKHQSSGSLSLDHSALIQQLGEVFSTN